MKNSGTAFGDARDDLQDSGLRDGRLLARLLPVGVVLLDDSQGCCFASGAACELLGAADESALRAEWGSIRAALDLSGLSGRGGDDPPLQRRVDLRNASGTRPLRIEVHTIPGDSARHVMLLRDRERLDCSDRTLLLASEARANRHVLTGLVHEAKGPLNNFSLTLALLTSTIDRMESSPVPDATVARWRRYLDVMRAEATRLSDCINEIHALTQPDNAVQEQIDVAATLRHVVRVLRHEATMREVSIELRLPAVPMCTAGDPHSLRLALLGLTACVLDVTQRSGVVAWHAAPPGDDRRLVLHLRATKALLPAPLIARFFGICAVAESEHAAAIAARIIIEAHGGDVAIDSQPGSHCEFSLSLRNTAKATVGGQ